MIAPRLFPTLCATIAVAMLAAPAVAQQTPAERADAMLAYAQCMRDNGYAEFPDPTPDGNMRILIDPKTAPRFQKAGAACRDLAPEGFRDEEIAPEELEALVRLSQCVRENGLPDFPDPDSSGRFDPRSIGVRPGDPRLDAAMATCREQAGLPPGGRIMIGG